VNALGCCDEAVGPRPVSDQNPRRRGHSDQYPPGGGGMDQGGGVHDSPSTPSPGGAPHTPPPAKWIHSIGEDVAEELIHALAREVADSRAREETLREELVAARDARDDARRALVREVHRVHELERLRVTDLSDLHTAEQKARSAMVTAWSLRDRLATAAAQVEGFEVDDDNDQAFTLFDEHGALIEGDDAASTFPEEDPETIRKSSDTDLSDDEDDLLSGNIPSQQSGVEMDPISLASAAVKASRARSMYDDVRRFFFFFAEVLDIEEEVFIFKEI